VTSAPQAPPHPPRRDLRAARVRSPWPYRRRLWLAAAAAITAHATLYFFSGKSLLTGVEFGIEDPAPSVDVELVEQAAPEPEPPTPPPPPPEPPRPEPVPEPLKPDDMAPPKPEPTPAPKPVVQRSPPKPNPKPAASLRPQTATSAASGTPGRSGTPTTGRTTGPGHLYNPKPGYPPESRAAGEHGIVVLRVRVEANGRPGSVALTRSSGHPRLDRAAQEAVRRWRFKPATRDGRPFATTVDVPVRFSLQ